MPDGRVTPNNKIRSAYENFESAFQVAVEDANRELILPSRPVGSCFSRRDAVAVEFRRSLCLRNWPHRMLGATQRLDVVISALETFQLPSWQLTESTVYTNYLLVTNTTGRLVQSLHYDFVAPGQPSHPYFHVQLTHELIPNDQIQELRTAGFNLDLQAQANPTPCWFTTRIPTPDMTLASVLYCLVADHLDSGIYRSFAEKVRSIQDRLPMLGFDTVRDSMKASKHFKSSHWYAHMH